VAPTVSSKTMFWQNFEKQELDPAIKLTKRPSKRFLNDSLKPLKNGLKKPFKVPVQCYSFLNSV
jgi:hypothetical protein